MLGLLILGRGIFWLVGFLCDAVFCGVMVFGGFLVWGWFQFFWGVVSVPFSVALDAVGLLFLCWGVGWFGGLVFIGFLGFCRVLPVCTVSILRVFIFFGGWLTVQP